MYALGVITVLPRCMAQENYVTFVMYALGRRINYVTSAMYASGSRVNYVTSAMCTLCVNYITSARYASGNRVNYATSTMHICLWKQCHLCYSCMHVLGHRVNCVTPAGVGIRMLRGISLLSAIYC